MRLAAFALALNAVSTPVVAQIVPEPGTPNPRIQTVRWQDGQTIQLTALPATGLTVLLEPGERIERVEANRARVDARISSERDGLLLIPRSEGALGTVAVTTDRREYRFDLRTGTDLMAAYLVRLTIGPQAPELSPVSVAMAQPVFPPMQPPMPIMPRAQVWSYRVKGDAAVRPAEITDDGARTTIAFAAGAALPAVFAIGPSGDEQVVNGYMRGESFVIDEVWQELVFRINDEKASAKRSDRPEDARG